MKIAEVSKVCVVGAGVMGKQIGLNAAIAGYEVVVTDTSREALEEARRWSGEYLSRQQAKGRMTTEQIAATTANYRLSGDIEEAASAADLVIEAVVEKVEIKRDVFACLDKSAPRHAILASNSSYIPSSRLVDATTRPDKVANLHYFNPVMVMQLVEVVKGQHTGDETVRTLVDFVKSISKVPICVKKEIEGFVVNRLLFALQSEAYYLVENDIASVEDIDLAAEKGLNHPMGPFRLMDLTGIDINYLNRERKYKESGLEKDRPPKVLVEKYLKGEYGRKTGKGWYDYTDSK